MDHQTIFRVSDSLRAFLRVLGGAAVGGVLGALVGWDGERAVPPGPDGRPLHDAGAPDSPLAPQDMGADNLEADSMVPDLLSADQALEGAADGQALDGGGKSI